MSARKVPKSQFIAAAKKSPTRTPDERWNRYGLAKSTGNGSGHITG
jgi:hypothetical protein